MQHKNWVSERMIQTHNAKARAMLLDCTLPPSMWAEGMSTANYWHTRSPTSLNNGMTPYEKLFGRKPEVGYLCVKILPCLLHLSRQATKAGSAAQAVLLTLPVYSHFRSTHTLCVLARLA